MVLEGYEGNERSEMDRMLKVKRDDLIVRCLDFFLIWDIVDVIKYVKLLVLKKGFLRNLFLF